MKKWITSHGIEVVRLNGFRCNCFLIITADETWMIDTGVLCDKQKIQKQIDLCGVKKLSGIILTHAHINHVESTEWFSTKYQCPVYIHDSELHFIQTGDCLIPKAAKKSVAWIEGIVRFIPFLNKYPACREATALTFEEPVIWNPHVKLMETPGHSEGGVSILVDDEIAIVADLMRGTSISLFWANQPGLVEVSWKKLLQEPCSLFLPSHGREISRKRIEKALAKK